MGSPSVSCEAVFSMNIMLKSDVPPIVRINTTITVRLLQIPFLIVQFIMVKICLCNSKTTQLARSSKVMPHSLSLQNINVLLGEFPKLSSYMRIPDILLRFKSFLCCDVGTGELQGLKMVVAMPGNFNNTTQSIRSLRE